MTRAVDLAENGCNIIFANSFMLMRSYHAQAARAYPDVMFCHATGEHGCYACGSGQLHQLLHQRLRVPLCFRRGCRHEACRRMLDGRPATVDRPLSRLRRRLPLCGGRLRLHRVPPRHPVHRARRLTWTFTYTNSWFDITAESGSREHPDGRRLRHHRPARRLHRRSLRCAGRASKPAPPSTASATTSTCCPSRPQAALTSAQNCWGVYYTYRHRRRA